MRPVIAYHSFETVSTHQTARDRFGSNMTMRNWDLHECLMLLAEHTQFLHRDFKEFINLNAVADGVRQDGERFVFCHVPQILIKTTIQIYSLIS